MAVLGQLGSGQASRNDQLFETNGGKADQLIITTHAQNRGGHHPPAGR